MSYISVNLTVSDPQPGNYSLYTSDCGTGSTQQLIATGLTNPDSFPYYFETTDFSGTSGSTCITYELIDTITSCSCTGSVSLVTPTPTISFTPTPTPSLTPLVQGNNSLSITTTYPEQTGSNTIVIVEVITKFPTIVDTDISFDMTLEDSVGTKVTQSFSGRISNGSNSVETNLTFAITYENLVRYYTEFENIVCSDTNALINTQSTPSYSQLSYGNPPDELIVHEWISCCCESQPCNSIMARVLESATQPGGWVYEGNVVTYDGTCYKSIGPGFGQTQLTFLGPNQQSCESSVCVDACDDGTGAKGNKFTANLKECCPPYQIYTNIVLNSDSFPNSSYPILFFNGQMSDGTAQIPPGCYSILNWSDTAAPNAHLVFNYYPSCNSCHNYNINGNPCEEYSFIWRAENCCDSNDLITVVLGGNVSPVLSNQPGFTYNGNCYRLILAEQNNNVPSIFIPGSSIIFSNICSNQLCPSCPTPTPTPTPSTTPVGWTAVTRQVEIIGCCDNLTYTANLTLNISTSVNDYVYLISSLGSIGSGCYRVTNILSQVETSQGVITENYGSSSCTPCLNSFPCSQRYTGCTDSCSVVPYPFDTVSYIYAGVTYNIPTVIQEPSHLAPLADENGVITDNAMLACLIFYNGSTCTNIEYFCDTFDNGDGMLTTADLLTLLGIYGGLQSYIQEQITCPSVYTQGLSPNLGGIYYVPQEDACYEYVGEVGTSVSPITFSIDTEYTGCTECIEVMIPTPTPTPTTTITPTPTSSITPTITPTNTVTPTVTPSTTPTQFIYKVKISGCCDSQTYIENIQFTNQISQITDTFYWEGDGTQNLIPQCYTILQFVLSPSSIPSFTIDNSAPYGDCATCLSANACNFLYRAQSCCTYGVDDLFVNVTGSIQPILGVHGFAFNGNCYLFVSGQGSGTGSMTVNSDNFIAYLCSDIIENQQCNPCPSVTPSVTPSITTTPSVTATPSITVTPTITTSITPTPTVTPTNTLPISWYEVTDCCSETAGFPSIGIVFTGSINSLSVGDVVALNSNGTGAALFRIVSTTSNTDGAWFYVGDSQIFTGGANNCVDAINAYPTSCGVGLPWYTGCTSGLWYALLDDDTTPWGGNIYGTSVSVEIPSDVLLVNGDCAVRLVDDELYIPNADFAGNIIVNNDTVIFHSDCYLCPTSTPTPTPSITPTLTPTLTPTITPTPSVTSSPIPEAIQCDDNFTIDTSDFNNVLNPDGTIQSYSTSKTVINATLNLSSCAGMVKFALQAQFAHDRFVVKNSSDEVVIDSLLIGQPSSESLVDARVGNGPYLCNVFTWNNDTDQLEFTSTQSVPVTVTDFPYHSDAGNYTYPLYDNVWSDNGISRYGAKGQIGGTLEYFNMYSGTYVPPAICGTNIIPDDVYAGCGGFSNRSRVFSFEKPQGESIYTLTVYGGLFNSTAYGFQIIECPSC